MGSDIDLLDGDDSFWELAETQLLNSTSNASRSVGASAWAAQAKQAISAPRAVPSVAALSRPQQGASSGPAQPAARRTQLYVNPKIGNMRSLTMQTEPAAVPTSYAPPTSAPGPSQSATGPGFRQRNLFGEVIADAPVAGSSRSRSLQETTRNGPTSTQRSGRPAHSQLVEGENLTAQMTFKAQKVTKQWDFSQPVRKGKKNGGMSANSKGKQRAVEDHEYDEFLSDYSGEEMAHDQSGESSGAEEGRTQSKLPGRNSPMKQKIDLDAAKTWIYPTNKSFRSYQYNIVQKALFNNVLVALPTGLGKTFIAAVVILNFYRWFPEGKIIFVAPTKPLVSQQQVACHGICGLPWDQAIELTGSTKSRMRGDEWQTKRIFYMTPQTFENDLTSSSCDPRDVVCVVVDEAHRATGNYAYGCVIRHIMRYNRHFRVLALTATPGSKSEKVQEVIDSLHIGHIEIRSEEALDIRSYVHKKVENRVVVSPGPVVGPLQEALGMMMRNYLDPAIGAGLLRSGTDPRTLHSFHCRQMMRDHKNPVFSRQPHLRACLSELATLADCMQTLVVYSVEMFRGKFFEAAAKAQRAQGPKRKLYSTENKHYERILQILEDAKDPKTNQVVHPKMDALLETVQKHFSDHDAESEQFEIVHWTAGDGLRGKPPPMKRETKAMVFCHFRESVAELVNYLNANGLKAVSFVGQASSKGSKGCTQKQQEQIIRDFKAGKTNVIVATSIGEEGLDIGEIDLIVCYDAQKDPVRMLQRIGRTGRQRDGKIYVLLSEGKEENNWQQSKDSYKTVQKEINAGYSCELFDDVERLIPNDIQPACVKEDVAEHEFDPELINQHISRKKGPTARIKKEEKDPMRNIPQGSILGFLKASEVRKPSAAPSKRQDGAKKGKVEDDPFDDAEVDEDDDFDWSVLDQIPTQKLQSTKRPAPSDTQASKGRSASGPQSIYIPKPVRLTPTPPQPSTKTTFGTGLKIPTRALGTGPRRAVSTGSALTERSNGKGLSSLSSLQDEDADAMPHRKSPHPLVLQMAAASGLDVDALTGSSSRSVGKRAKPHRPIQRTRDEQEDDDDDEEEEEEEDGDDDDQPIQPARRGAKKRTMQRLMQSSSSSPARPDDDRRWGRTAQGSTSAGGKRKRAQETAGASTSAKKPKLPKLPKKPIGNSQTSRGLFAYEAERDTDEEMHGDKDEDDEGLDTDEADSSDREHVGDFDPTQHPDAKYNQRSVYAQSLMTQTSLTPFKRGSRSFGVGGYFGEGGVGRAGFDNKGNPLQSSRGAAAPMDGSDDRYTQDSFVVGDDEEIEFLSDEDGDSSD
ncbi:3'-5' DNA helicase [Tilletia horrida]|uniref:ATP-dependent DNA helicase n=1 Tax=Tilletia horrida TaxID=155126 RepID=A0AAN6JIK4_9BASI|nr:3'-5' DNA helicase [Tilletia horrida]